ncbi:MAG TPA: DegT/DnrJ/EryC1/StrS family aminotransferase, partial [Candidatus Angelobacter sp.]
MKSAGHKAAADVPMLDLSRQYASIRTEILAAVARVCDSQHYILGEEVTAFEREFAALCATADCVGCASGTDGLWLALAAAGIGPGDSVITTPFSFFATASSILRAGAKPVFADVDPETLNLDPASVEDRLKTAPRGMHALMPVHLYGQCADMDAFQRLAAEFKVHLVEDAAQAVGASWNGKHAGSLGLAAAFSFYPTKNLSAFGDAGAVTTSNATLAERMRSLRNHGGKQRYFHDEVGANSRLDSIQAAVLRVKMSYLAKWNEARRERARTYGRLLTSAGLTRTGAASLAPIVLLKTLPSAYHIYHQYVIRVRDRDKLRTFLGERGIGSEIY